jgi:hypothetical protein
MRQPFLFSLLLFAGFAHAEPVQEALATSQQATQAAASSQQVVNGLDNSLQSAQDRYRSLLYRTQQLQVYGEQLKGLLAAQAAEKASLQRQMREFSRTERDLLPLLLRMLDSLDKFVTLDIPFLKQERRDRIDKLRQAMTAPDVPVAEKFRRVLEAYQVEIGYGRELGAENGVVNNQPAELLRVGRMVWYFRTADGQLGRWDGQNGQWRNFSVETQNQYGSELREGLKIARNQSAPRLLHLPVGVK